MTLTSALAALHAAGRIRSPWLPGGRVLSDDGAGRIVAVGRAGVQLIEWERTVGRRTWGWAEVPTSWTPDTSDAATSGCLLALLREASGDRGACVVCLDEQQGWEVVDSGLNWVYEGPICLTEAAALSAALVALAEALPSTDGGAR